jgi:molybdopterin-guanine dinucleotide biosynthesis protein A
MPGKGGISVRDLGVLILAGGGSKRFGGEKAFFEINEKPMIQQVVERISELSGELVISCRSGGKKLAKMFPKAKITVDKSGIRGALTGLVSGLPEIKSRYTVVVTCDCPMINPEVIKVLFEYAKGRGGAVPRWPSGYVEPLQAVYNTEKLRVAVQGVWRKGRMKLTDVLGAIPDLAYIPTAELANVDPGLRSFINVNSPEDLKSLRLG